MRTAIGVVVVGLLLVIAAPWRGLIRDERRGDNVPVVEVAVFEAGFGIDWHLDVARTYERERAEAGRPIEINLWGDPRVLDKVRPRILARRPPTLLDGYPPFWTLVLSGKLLPFDDMLDEPAPGRPGQRIRDTFYAGALDFYTYQGKTYAIPTVYNAWVFWYDKKQFRDHGWRVPATWQELTALCASIKAAGVAPVAFQGKYGVYSGSYFWHLVQSCGGIELFDRCEATDPNAFRDSDAIRAARLFQDFAMNYFQTGSLSMTHTEAQTEFCLGRAAMVACGLYFESEMRRLIPAEMELSAFPMPPVEGGKGDPRALYAGPTEAIHLLSDGANADEALAFVGYLLSPKNMQSFASRKNTLVAIEPANDGADLSPAMRDVRAFVETRTVRYMDALESYAQAFEIQFRRPLTDQLLRGTISPEDFAEALARGMEVVRRDPDFVCPQRTIRKNADVPRANVRR